jgi:hypothetical protein
MAFLGALLVAVRVGGQATTEPDLRPSLNALEPQTVTLVRTDESGNVIEEQVTGHTNEPTGGPRALYAQQPWSVPYGGAPYVPDEESQSLFQEEQAAAAEARQLTTQFQRAYGQGRPQVKAQLREKLVEIFELQQKRRQREVGQIEERLSKLKDTMAKRTAAKDSIVDRRLETLTGGIDELGWEETGARGPGATWTMERGFGYGGFGSFAPTYPQPPNVPAAPRAKTSPRPPRAGQPPQPQQPPQPPQQPQAAPAPAPAPVPVAPVPPALPAPAVPPSASPAVPPPPAAAIPPLPRGK